MVPFTPKQAQNKMICKQFLRQIPGWKHAVVILGKKWTRQNCPNCWYEGFTYLHSAFRHFIPHDNSITDVERLLEGTRPDLWRPWHVAQATVQSTPVTWNLASCEVWLPPRIPKTKKSAWKKPKENSFTGLVKGKFTGNPWVFTMKYRVFLWIFPSSNSMTVASSQWSYEEVIFPLQMWHFLEQKPIKD